jgi:hypothetical protein
MPAGQRVIVLQPRARQARSRNRIGATLRRSRDSVMRLSGRRSRRLSLRKRLYAPGRPPARIMITITVRSSAQEYHAALSGELMRTLNEVYSSLSTRRRYEVWFVRFGLADGTGAWRGEPSQQRQRARVLTPRGSTRINAGSQNLIQLALCRVNSWRGNLRDCPPADTTLQMKTLAAV